MTYKTILAVVTDRDALQQTIGAASDLARDCDAHLDVLCLGVDRTQGGYYFAGATAVVLQETLSRARAEAQELAQRVEHMLAGTGLAYVVEHGVAQMMDVSRHVAQRARFADLCVVAKPYGAGVGVEMEPAVEGALFDGDSPVYIPSGAGQGATAHPERVVLAWNDAPEALRAIRRAMPMLTAAKRVHVVVIDPPQHGQTRSDPGGLLAQYLARHGVKVEINVLAKTLPRVSDVLKRHATDVGADLIVMGAYGHSRFREAVLGGATRHMLEHAEIPVVMAH
ncbi:universal stress protein [Sagittula sp. SSi028]|uniref:universal stress protein n=1 Tax=Sagittula sp. SSi028 TaxID=3400636 RepID=UPI003AF58CC3